LNRKASGRLIAYRIPDHRGLIRPAMPKGNCHAKLALARNATGNRELSPAHGYRPG